MEWTSEKVMRFLKLYKSHPCIWNPKDSGHKNRKKVNNAWIEIQNGLGERCTVKDLKKKRESLMSAFRGYKAKIRKSETCGDPTLKYHPVWFAYEFMNSFLGDVYKGYKSNVVIKTEDTYQDEETSVINVDYLDDTGDESDTTRLEDKYLSVSHLGQSTSMDPDSESMTATTSKRKERNPLELQRIKKRKGREFHVRRSQRVEDECSIFGKLVEAKMRKLSEDRRDFMMIKINQLFYDENHEQNDKNSPDMSECYLNTSSP